MGSYPVARKKIDSLPSFDVTVFREEVKELEEFCQSIQNYDDTTQKLMKNYVYIRLISIVEFHLKGLVAMLVDDLDIKAQDILRDDFMPIKLDVLDNLESEKMTKGNMISAFLDKMTPGKIRTIMSKVNKLDFFEWYQDILAINTTKSEEKVWTHINETYQKRNDIVHNLYDTEDSTDVLTDEVEAFSEFTGQMFAFTFINLGIFEQKIPREQIDDWINMFEKGDKIEFEKEFTKITKEYRIKQKQNKKYR